MSQISSSKLDPVPHFSAKANVNQTLADSALVNVAFNTTIIDTDNQFVSPNFTVSAPGLWFFRTSLWFASAAAAGARQICIVINGAFVSVTSEGLFAGANTFLQEATALERLVAGDVVVVQALQTSGGNLDLQVDATYASTFQGARYSI